MFSSANMFITESAVIVLNYQCNSEETGEKIMVLS